MKKGLESPEERVSYLLNSVFYFQLLISIYFITCLLILFLGRNYLLNLITIFELNNFSLYFEEFLHNPSGYFLVIVGIISAFILFSYFMHDLYLNGLNRTILQIQQKEEGHNERYFWSFMNNTIIISSISFLVIIWYLVSTKTIISIEILLVLLSWILTVLAQNQLIRIKPVISNYDAEIIFNEYLEKNDDNDFKRFLNRQIYHSIWIIYFLIFLILIIGYIYQFNLISMLIIEYSLIFSFYALSAIKETPKKRLTIFTDSETFANIYILSETKFEIFILLQDSKVSRIARKNIYKIENYFVC